MAGGIGFVRDAQNGARVNRANLKNKGNFQLTYKQKNSRKELVFKESTPQELEQFRAAFLKRKRLRAIKRAILMVLVFAGIGWMIWHFLF